MKNILKTICIICLLLLAFCKKEPASRSHNANEHAKDLVRTWLHNSKEKENTKSGRTAIDSISKAVNWSSGLVFILNNEVSIISFKLREDGYLIALKKSDEIYNGYILKLENIKANVNENTLLKYHNTQEISGYSGDLIVNSITSTFIEKSSFVGGKLKSKSLVQKTNPDLKSKKGPKTSELVCIDWFLVTTYYYPNGSTSTTEEYMGRTCQDDFCNFEPQMIKNKIKIMCTGGAEAPAPVIEIDARDTSILNNPKVKCMLGKLLGNNTKFDSLLTAFKGSGYNLKFKLDNLPIAPGRTQAPNGNTSNPNDGPNFLINLDRNFVASANLIEIGKTLLHEAFHANLSQHAYQVFGTTNISTWPEKPENMDMPDLIDMILLKAQGNTTLQSAEHEYMAKNIQSIAGGLRELIEKYGSNTSSFTDHYYTSLAFDGLTGTAYYNNYMSGKTYDLYGTVIPLKDYYNNIVSDIRQNASINCNN